MRKATPEDRQRVVGLLDRHKDMTIATNRPDGWPQATVVSYVSEGTTCYFGCGPDSQKAQNIRTDNRVSVAIAGPYTSWSDISGLSMAARATEVAEIAEIERIAALMFDKFPEAIQFVSVEPTARPVLFRVEPEIVSILDYSKGFGHTELVHF